MLAGCDRIGSLVASARVLLDGFAPKGGTEHPGVGVGVAGEMSEDMTDAPALEPARSADADFIERVDRLEQAPVRCPAPVDHLVEPGLDLFVGV